MPTFSPEQAAHLEREYTQVHAGLLRAYFRTITFGQSQLTDPNAAKYMVQGVARRLSSIRHALERIFEIFPPGTETPIRRELLEDVNINLQAFVLHVNALQDNFAWAFVLERDLPLGRHDVSLFRPALQAHLPEAMREYLETETVANWRTQYSTDFRDALAHRIPLYVPPSQLTAHEGERASELQRIFNEAAAAGDWSRLIQAQEELNALGSACPYFLHDPEGNQIILHPQILSDGMTATELVNVVLDNWPVNRGRPND